MRYPPFPDLFLIVLSRAESAAARQVTATKLTQFHSGVKPTLWPASLPRASLQEVIKDRSYDRYHHQDGTCEEGDCKLDTGPRVSPTPRFQLVAVFKGHFESSFSTCSLKRWQHQRQRRQWRRKGSLEQPEKSSPLLFFFAMVFCSVPFFVRRRAGNGLPFQIRRRHY